MCNFLHCLQQRLYEHLCSSGVKLYDPFLEIGDLLSCTCQFSMQPYQMLRFPSGSLKIFLNFFIKYKMANLYQTFSLNRMASSPGNLYLILVGPGEFRKIIFHPHSTLKKRLKIAFFRGEKSSANMMRCTTFESIF